jgi:hypothetical protein
MTVKKTSSISPEIIEQYRKVIQSIGTLEMKGATMPYTSHNGHMFSFLDKDGNMALRLLEREREEFIKKFRSSLCEAHGTVLKEYVSVPVKLFKDTTTLKKYFRDSYNYVAALKPKPSKK